MKLGLDIDGKIIYNGTIKNSDKELNKLDLVSNPLADLFYSKINTEKSTNNQINSKITKNKTSKNTQKKSTTLK